jgi:hypothetical protein
MKFVSVQGLSDWEKFQMNIHGRNKIHIKYNYKGRKRQMKTDRWLEPHPLHQKKHQSSLLKEDCLYLKRYVCNNK